MTRGLLPLDCLTHCGAHIPPLFPHRAISVACGLLFAVGTISLICVAPSSLCCFSFSFRWLGKRKNPRHQVSIVPLNLLLSDIFFLLLSCPLFEQIDGPPSLGLPLDTRLRAGTSARPHRMWGCVFPTQPSPRNHGPGMQLLISRRKDLGVQQNILTTDLYNRYHFLSPSLSPI